MFPANLLTWLKLGAALALLLALAGSYAYWQHLKSEAALVPQLSARIASDDQRASALSARLAQVTAARDEADTALDAWQTQKTSTLTTIRKESAHAAASTNPSCLPGDADRRLRNDALAKLLGTGQASGAAQLP